jgi:hypothetical protein
MTKNFPDEILSAHTAVLGKTGSGKTSTAKLMIEQVCAQDSRVCILDPIKSDWWGLTSSHDGRRAGLPFHILGGPRGHVPLHSAAGAAIGAVVASGALRHSIIDMADFEPGGLERFFSAFAQSLFRNMTGVVYLVVEEAHIFAPKERLMGEQNLAIHWMKRLASAARSKGVRMIVCTHRTQELHNAVLGSCNTIIAHRLIAPADQKPVLDWLKANSGVEKAKEIGATLAKLKTGHGWVCPVDLDIYEKSFPRITTFDNSATPDDDAAKQQVKTAPVDTDSLGKIIGTAVEEAKANDPRELKLQIASPKKDLAKAQTAKPAPAAEIKTVDRPMLKAADIKKIESAAEQTKKIIETGMAQLRTMFDATMQKLTRTDAPLQVIEAKVKAINAAPISVPTKILHPVAAVQSRPIREPRPARTTPLDSGDGFSRVEVALLTALAQHRNGLSKMQATIYAGYKPSGDISSAWSMFTERGYIQSTSSGVRITDEGLAALGPYEDLPRAAALQEYWLNRSDSPVERELLAAMFTQHIEEGRTKAEWIELAGYRPSGDVSSAWSKFNRLGWTQRTANGVKAAAFWFEE